MTLQWAGACAPVTPEFMHMTDRYPRIYRRLIAAGHSAATAIEMMIDAKRGDHYSMKWIRGLCRGKA